MSATIVRSSSCCGAASLAVTVSLAASGSVQATHTGLGPAWYRPSSTKRVCSHLGGWQHLGTRKHPYQGCSEVTAPVEERGQAQRVGRDLQRGHARARDVQGRAARVQAEAHLHRGLASLRMRGLGGHEVEDEAGEGGVPVHQQLVPHREAGQLVRGHELAAVQVEAVQGGGGGPRELEDVVAVVGQPRAVSVPAAAVVEAVDEDGWELLGGEAGAEAGGDRQLPVAEGGQVLGVLGRGEAGAGQQPGGVTGPALSCCQAGGHPQQSGGQRAQHCYSRRYIYTIYTILTIYNIYTVSYLLSTPARHTPPHLCLFISLLLTDGLHTIDKLIHTQTHSLHTLDIYILHIYTNR